MLNDDGKYYYTDDFMFFDFKNINSERYNLFRVNEGESSYFYTNSNFTSQYTSPDYQTTSYYLGTKESQKTFDWKCAAEGLSFRRVEEMLLWLQPGQIGMLRFDGSVDWGYWVVVDQISNINKFLQADNTYVVEFSIVFKTIGCNYIQGYYSAYGKLGEDAATINETAVNQYGIPEAILIETVDSMKLYIQQIGNKFYTFKYRTNVSDISNSGQIVKKDLKISSGDNTLVNYSFSYKGDEAQIVTYDTATGLLLLGDDFVENTDSTSLENEENSISNICYAASCTPIEVQVRLDGTAFKLTSSYDIDFRKKKFLCATKLDPSQQVNYGDNYSYGSYPVKYLTHIWYGIEISDDGQINIPSDSDYGTNFGNDYSGCKFYIGYYDEYDITDKDEIQTSETATVSESDSPQIIYPHVLVTKYNLL